VAALFFPTPAAGGEALIVVAHPLLGLGLVSEGSSVGTIECAAELAAPTILIVLLLLLLPL